MSYKHKFDTTNGGLRVRSGPVESSIIISTMPEILEMSAFILYDELPWLINALEDIHRELTADANRARDAAALDEWDADVLASMMTG